MPTKRRRDERGGGRAGAANPPRRRRHLYIVLDDWAWGYSIRKISLPSINGTQETDAIVGLQSMPPAVLHLEAPRGLPEYFTAAFGATIVAMHPREDGVWDGESRPRPLPRGPRVLRHPLAGAVPRPSPTSRTPRCTPSTSPSATTSSSPCAGLFQVLRNRASSTASQEVWSWSTLPDPPEHLDPRCVVSSAVHPDARTVFLSAFAPEATYSFQYTEEAAEGMGVTWKTHGKWVLPFSRHAHFDPELQAWVGLSGIHDALGHVCACEVPLVSSAADSDCLQLQCPAWKFSKERLLCFSEVDPAETHFGATLLYLGGGSEYCVVECISMERYSEEEDRALYYDEVRLTTFSLKYDGNGELTCGNNIRHRYYVVPAGVSREILERPVAFWM
ncbi:hypothetical protein QOZ80_3AG0216260 [Eleusine coracana subsp. coracana]|nr:hypothetical protein QOZ80_3AG0216260 [Eleusine coracana subsp. coracana]